MIKTNKNKSYNFESFNGINGIDKLICQIPDSIRIINGRTIIETDILYDDLNSFVINENLKSLSFNNIYEFIGNIVIDINDDIDDRSDIRIIQIERSNLRNKPSLNLIKNNPNINILLNNSDIIYK